MDADLTNLTTTGEQRLAMDNVKALLAEIEASEGGPEVGALWDGTLSLLFELEQMERAAANRPRFIGLLQAARRAIAAHIGAKLDDLEEEPASAAVEPAGWRQAAERSALGKSLGDFMADTHGVRRR